MSAVCVAQGCANDISQLVEAAKTKPPRFCTDACRKEHDRHRKEDERAREDNSIVLLMAQAEFSNSKKKRSESRNSSAFIAGTPGTYDPMYEASLRAEGWSPGWGPPKSLGAYEGPKTTFEDIEAARKRDAAGPPKPLPGPPINRLLDKAAIRVRKAETVHPSERMGTTKSAAPIGRDRALDDWTPADAWLSAIEAEDPKRALAAEDTADTARTREQRRCDALPNGCGEGGDFWIGMGLGRARQELERRQEKAVVVELRPDGLDADLEAAA